jgi:hypothetical protein
MQPELYQVRLHEFCPPLIVPGPVAESTGAIYKNIILIHMAVPAMVKDSAEIMIAGPVKYFHILIR